MSSDHIDLVVVGAHLSGLALNHELRTLGANFVRADHTAPVYRLFALEGIVPPKPGMLRVAEDGVSLNVEVWRLDLNAFGAFVAKVPAPLSIGSVVLAGGEVLKGFLVEPVALAKARDISEFGGWREYMASLEAVV